MQDAGRGMLDRRAVDVMHSSQAIVIARVFQRIRLHFLWRIW